MPSKRLRRALNRASRHQNRNSEVNGGIIDVERVESESQGQCPRVDAAQAIWTPVDSSGGPVSSGSPEQTAVSGRTRSRSPIRQWGEENCVGAQPKTPVPLDTGVKGRPPTPYNPLGNLRLKTLFGVSDAELFILKDFLLDTPERKASGYRRPFALLPPADVELANQQRPMLQNDVQSERPKSRLLTAIEAAVRPRKYSSSSSGDSMASFTDASASECNALVFEGASLKGTLRNQPFVSGGLRSIDLNNIPLPNHAGSQWMNFGNADFEVPRQGTATRSGESQQQPLIPLQAVPGSSAHPVPSSLAVAGKPAIYVVPLRTINFTDMSIQFIIQALNTPETVNLRSTMLEAVAQTPSGKMLKVSMKETNQANPRSPREFAGNFTATDEAGVYSLRVRLVLPFAKYSGRAAGENPNFGVVGDSSNIIVSRNYLQQSQIAPVNVIQIQPHLPMPSAMATDKAVHAMAWGITCDKETNRLYYSERSTHRVTCMDPATGEILFWFNGTAGNRLSRPCGICFDHYNRRVLVCDKDNHRICIFSPEGDYVSSFGSSGYEDGEFRYPWDVDVSSDGNHIVVTHSRNNYIQLFDRNGNFLSKYSIMAAKPLDSENNNVEYPRGVCFNIEGDQIYVTDFNAQNILEVSLSFTASKYLCAPDKLKRPVAIVCDPLGNLLVCDRDAKGHVVRHLTPEGELLSYICSVGQQQLLFCPINLTLLRDGRVALLDANGKLHIF